MIGDQAEKPNLTLQERVLLNERDIADLQEDVDKMGKNLRINAKADLLIRQTVDAAKSEMKGASATWKKITVAIAAALAGVKICQFIAELFK